MCCPKGAAWCASAVGSDQVLTRLALIAAAVGLGWILFDAPWIALTLSVIAAVATALNAPTPPLAGRQEALATLPPDADVTLGREATTVFVPLDPTIPRLYAVGPVDTLGPALRTGDPRFDRVVRFEASPERWLVLLTDDVRAQLVRLAPDLGYDRARHGLTVSARDATGHARLGAQVEIAQALARRLASLAHEPSGDALRQRLERASTGEERLELFKLVWRADRALATRLAEELAEPRLRYFVATASTPPDRAFIEQTALDRALPPDLRAEATLRWMGLGGDAERLIDVLAECAAAPRALEALGERGEPRHLPAIGSQRLGPNADLAQRALIRLKQRYPGLGDGALAMAEPIGHLALVEGGEEGRLALAPLSGDAAEAAEPPEPA